MKLTHRLKIVLLFAFTSLQMVGMESTKEEKPTKFIFDAIGYYEQGKFKEAAEIFKRYAGKPIPVAEPFCLDFVKKGHLNPFEPIPSNEEMGEKTKASMYFTAAQQFLKVKRKLDSKYDQKTQVLLGRDTLFLKGCLEEELQNGANGAFLYIIGTLCEASVDCTDDAKRYFKRALKEGDIRGIFGLKRVCDPEEFKRMVLANELFLWQINSAFSLMPILHQGEGTTFAKLSGYFPDFDKKSEFLLHAAALFGHPDAQFLWGLDHCKNDDSKQLYWAMQSAEHGNLDALNTCGYLIEKGKGTEVNYEKAYDYYKRAAHYPETEAVHFYNLALCYDEAKGTLQDYQSACEWYEKAYKADSSNQQFIYRYARVLRLMGEYEKALPLLADVQHLSDDAAYNYAVVLKKLTPEEGGLTEVTRIFSQLASKGGI